MLDARPFDLPHTMLDRENQIDASAYKVNASSQSNSFLPLATVFVDFLGTRRSAASEAPADGHFDSPSPSRWLKAPKLVYSRCPGIPEKKLTEDPAYAGPLESRNRQDTASTAASFSQYIFTLSFNRKTDKH